MLVSIFQGGGIRNKIGFDIPSQAGTLTYTGDSQSPIWRNYNPSTMTIGGTTSATNAGSYTATFTLIDTRMYQWKDGTTEAKAVTWTINKASLTVPSQSGTLTYNGSSQSPMWNDYDSSIMTIGGTTSATEAGTYTATFTLNDTANYQWQADATNSTKSVTWTIQAVSKTQLTVPSQSGTLTYTGIQQSPTWKNYSSSTMTIGGTTSAMSAGTYTATFSINDTLLYEWTDGTTSTKSVTWTIDKLTVAIPYLKGIPYDYTNYYYYFQWDGDVYVAAANLVYDSDHSYIASGTTQATDEGVYYIGFQLSNINNYQWADDWPDRYGPGDIYPVYDYYLIWAIVRY